MNANFLLLAEERSNDLFPEVKNHLEKPLKLSSKNQYGLVPIKKEYSLIGNELEIQKEWDILKGIEINGKFPKCPQMYDASYDLFRYPGRIPDKRNYLGDLIESIEIEIGGTSVLKFYMPNWKIDIDFRDFRIIINFEDIFVEQDFLPIICLQFSNLKFKINWGNMEGEIPASIRESIKYYLSGYLISSSETRKNLATSSWNLLTNDYIQYKNIVLKREGDRLFMNYGENMDELMCSGNFIKELHFNFNSFDIKNSINNIKIFVMDSLITTFTKSDMNFINDYEFTINDFYYKTFLFKKMHMEFCFDGTFEKVNLTLTTTNYNILNFNSGICAKRFIGLEREIRTLCGVYLNGIEIIDDNLFKEKVLPKLDVCCISHEEFEKNVDGKIVEDIVICGKCFTCMKKDYAFSWFKSKRTRICPYARCDEEKWYIWKEKNVR